MDRLIKDEKTFLESDLNGKRNILLDIFGTEEESKDKKALFWNEDSATGLLLADISENSSVDKDKNRINAVSGYRNVKIISNDTGEELSFSKDDPLLFIPKWYPKAQKQTEETKIPEGTKYVFIKFQIKNNDNKSSENDKDYILKLKNGEKSFFLLNEDELSFINKKISLIEKKREIQDLGIQETFEKLEYIKNEVKNFDKDKFKVILDDIDCKLTERKQVTDNLLNDIDSKLAERKKTAASLLDDVDSKLSERKQDADSFLEKCGDEINNQENAFQSDFSSKLEEFRKEKENLFSELDRKLNEIKKLSKKLSEDKDSNPSESQDSSEKDSALCTRQDSIKNAELVQACETLENDITELQMATSGEKPAFSELVTRVKEYMLSQGFIYSENQKIIDRFLSSLYTGQIIILSGPPGTGKTSLPRLVAEAVGAKLHFISVQSDWTDAQDLLGFYDYAHERYAATPFLDALRDAANEPYRMHFVVLDEMNLSHIEYYFSAVLSALEADRKLRLFGNSVKGTSDNPWPPEFIIPENVQFIGTLNMDDTTRRPSPKVLDRSYVIEINEAEDIPEDENGVKTGETAKETKPFILAADYFDPERADYAECFKTDEGKVKEMLSVLKSIASFEKLDDNDKIIINESRLSLSLSARAIKQAERMLRQGADIDAVVCGKLLVTAKSGNMIEDEAKLVGVLTANLEKNKPILEDTNLTLKKNYLTDWSISKQKIEKMIQDNEIDYWR